MSTKVLNVLVLLGSNSEDAEKFLARARTSLAARAHVLHAGSLWRTAAWGFEGPNFLNQVLDIEWHDELEGLLSNCLEVEQSLGRVRDAEGPRYTSRSIDIDLLLTRPFMKVESPRLELPHPRMPLRRFVLQPLAEYWGSWQANSEGRSVADLFATCTDQSAVHLLKG